MNFLKPDPSKLSNINGNVSIAFASSEHGLDFAIASFYFSDTEVFLTGEPAGSLRPNTECDITGVWV